MSVLVSMDILWIKSYISSARKVRILAMHESSNTYSSYERKYNDI